MKFPRWKIIGILIWAVLTVATLTFCSPSNSWPEITATITEVGIEPYSHSSRRGVDRGNIYHYKYKYKVSGQEYPAQSDVQISATSSSKPYAVGHQRSVYIDPDNPAKYQFEKGPDGAEGAVLIVALALEAVGLLWIVTERRF